MPSRLTIQVVQGCSLDPQLQVPNPADFIPWTDLNPSPFLSSDVLAATVWAGEDQAPLLTLVPTWVDVAAAIYQISLTNAQTAGLTVGTYRLQVTFTRSGRSGSIGNCRLEIQSAAGTAAAGATYATGEQLLMFAPWIQDNLDDNDETNYLAQRVRARSWIDDIFVGRFKPGGVWQLGDAGSTAYFCSFGIDQGPQKWLWDILAANTGKVPSVGPPIPGTIYSGTALICRDQVVEIVSKRALYYILSHQISKDGKNPYQRLARQFRAEADGLLKVLRAEIDLSGDGYGDFNINCGATSLR
jgi:hypothetical protein